MPGPYTDTERDVLIDAILARFDLIEPDLSQALLDIGALQTDNTTNISNIEMLQTGAVDLSSRIDAVEGVTIPAVDTLQDDMVNVIRSARRRQENDPAQLGKSQIVQRVAIEQVRRPDGRMAQRVVNPR